MELVEPSVFLVAETKISPGMLSYLQHIGAGDWHSHNAPSHAEVLVETMGRACYRSFGTELNANLTRVREGNAEYIGNIINVRHGSVLEHASVSFMFCDVSRVFTHELVRHRQGVAISQESLRFVRLTDLKFWIPSVIRESEDAMEIFEAQIRNDEDAQHALTDALITDDMPFSQKKVITSAMRRVAPMGLATNIGWTANFRTLRFVIEQRTSRHAEEEIRFVFARVAEILCDKYPNIFGDFEQEDIDGIDEWTTPNSKV